jgi:hypothetical protein
VAVQPAQELVKEIILKYLKHSDILPYLYLIAFSLCMATGPHVAERFDSASRAANASSTSSTMPGGVQPSLRGRLTARADSVHPSVYQVAYLDLVDGPIVFEAPPGLRAKLIDGFQRPLCSEGAIGGRVWCGDVGMLGPDKGKGATYVILPPDFKDDVPTEFLRLRSRTFGVFVLWREETETDANDAAEDFVDAAFKVHGTKVQYFRKHAPLMLLRSSS